MLKVSKVIVRRADLVLRAIDKHIQCSQRNEGYNAHDTSSSSSIATRVDDRLLSECLKEQVTT